MVEANNIIKDFKASSTPGKDSLYVNWKKEIKIWEAFMSVPEEERVLETFGKFVWPSGMSSCTLWLSPLSHGNTRWCFGL